MTFTAITINIVSILWCLIFLNYKYAGIILGVSAVIWFFVYVKKKQDELEASFQQRFAGKKILFMDKHARIIAQESHGYSQTMGMGYLVLTPEELYFKLQLINKELTIPVYSLLAVGETRRMKGKNPLRLMLKIDYKSSDGNKDAIALLVKDLPRWKIEISNVMKKNKKSEICQTL